MAAARWSPAARTLLSNLPDSMLAATAEQFPHVIEALASAWADPYRMTAIIDGLVFDVRRNRSGFPTTVMMELAELRSRYDR